MSTFSQELRDAALALDYAADIHNLATKARDAAPSGFRVAEIVAEAITFKARVEAKTKFDKALDAYLASERSAE